MYVNCCSALIYCPLCVLDYQELMGHKHSWSDDMLLFSMLLSYVQPCRCNNEFKSLGNELP